MTFEPGGDLRIPNQIGTTSPHPAQRRRRLRLDSPRAFNRALIVVSFINAILLAAAVMVIYVFEVVDSATGVWWLLAAAVPGSLLLTGTVLTYQFQRAKSQQQAPDDPTGTAPPAG